MAVVASSTTTDVEAVAAAAAPIATETTPLVPPTENNNEPPPLKDMKENTLKERAVATTAAVAFSTSLVSMLLEHNPAVYVSGMIGCIISPYAAIQQEKITQVEALKQTNERLEEEVSILQSENVRLKTEVKDLESSVIQLQINKTLDAVRAMEGQSVEELEEQLETSREILNSTRDNLTAGILQTLISVVLTCDKDGDLTLSDGEIDALIVKVEGMSGIDLKQDLLRAKLIEQGRSLNAILEVIRNILDDDVPEEKNIISYINKK